MTPNDLRDRLMAAHRDGDRQKFDKLCRRHADTIVRVFNDWAVAPAEIRPDRRAVAAYIEALAAIAQALAALGHPEPMARLSPDGPANPIKRWHYAYTRAEQLHHAGEYTASSTELHALLADMQGTIGPGVDDIRTKVAGMLGTNALRLGRIDEAIVHTREALRRSHAAGDLEGVWIYTENLDTLLVAEEVAAGTRAGTELAHTRDRLAFAQDLSDARRYAASTEVLRELLDILHGTAGMRYLGKIYGLLGLNYFRSNDPAMAEHCTRLALAECRQRQDYAGERIYTANLAVIEHRR
ncbi:hypothetical protein [Nocardia terpenica]|uniref:Tetratricopeptide repeat protein n=1 Tax=Nocardia terpenica TaxID=455432 RepID=A0A6G9Z1I2_9NOCA|nr:hypothetical protein [Nocardia terpenica]QIS19445.1 hypothetical protein F6W96_15285 [Nocardia terpenica]